MDNFNNLGFHFYLLCITVCLGFYLLYLFFLICREDGSPSRIWFFIFILCVVGPICFNYYKKYVNQMGQNEKVRERRLKTIDRISEK